MSFEGSIASIPVHHAKCRLRASERDPPSAKLHILLQPLGEHLPTSDLFLGDSPMVSRWIEYIYIHIYIYYSQPSGFSLSLVALVACSQGIVFGVVTQVVISTWLLVPRQSYRLSPIYTNSPPSEAFGRFTNTLSLQRLTGRPRLQAFHGEITFWTKLWLVSTAAQRLQVEQGGVGWSRDLEQGAFLLHKSIGGLGEQGDFSR